MKPELDRFLRDFCEATECALSDRSFPLEYHIKPTLIHRVGWDIWLKFSSNYDRCQMLIADPEDHELVSDVMPIAAVDVAWVFAQINHIYFEVRSQSTAL